MRECSISEGRANRIRAATCVLAIAVLIALGATGAGPAAAAEFEIGELRGHVDTTLSAGASMRVKGRDCKLIHSSNGGCTDDQKYLNSDDGDLNYDKWDVFANTYKATVDVDLAWKNFGGFFRGTLFYDLVTMNTNTARTSLDRDALYRSSALNSGVVGMGYQLLDAYLYGNFEVAGRPLEIRVGNQVLSWGESLFYQGGVSSINTVDLNRLRAPGSSLKEAFLPAPMVRVSAELFENLGIEAFYLLAWNYTQLDPPGSYFSTNDLVGRSAEGSYVAVDPGFDPESYEAATLYRHLLSPEPFVLEGDLSSLSAGGGIPEEAQVQRFNVDPAVFGLAPEDVAGLSDDYLRQLFRDFFSQNPEGLFETLLSPAAPVEVPLVPPLVPGDALVEALLDPIVAALISLGYYPHVETKVPAYFPAGFRRIKDEKARSQGQWGVALRYFAEAINTEFGAYYLRVHDKVPSVGFVADPIELTIQPTFEDLGFLVIPPAIFSLPTVTQWTGIPVAYFREYPEDINVYGLSFATELFGVALGGEVSYKTGNPVPIDGELLLRELIAEAGETRRRVKGSGFKREKRIQAQINAIATLGPGDPYLGAIVRALRVSSLAVTLEVGAVQFPSLDGRVVYQAPFTKDHVDEISWGYQTLIQGFYDNPFGVPVTLTPRLGFAHDVDGNTPGFYPFLEDRKTISAGVNVDYLGVWQFDLSYTNSWGGGGANLTSDRDWVSLSVTRSF